MTDDATHRLRVSLQRTRPEVWRRIEVPGSLTLDRLRVVLDVAMGWTGLDGHRFTLGSPREPGHQEIVPADVVAADVALERQSLARAGCDPDEWALGSQEVLVEEELRVRDVLPHERAALHYQYGLSWVHRVRVERVEGPGSLSRPRVLAGRRAVPPQYLVNGWNWTDLMAIVRAVAEGRGTPAWEAQVVAHFPGLAPQEAWDAVRRFDVAQADDILARLHSAGRV